MSFSKRFTFLQRIATRGAWSKTRPHHLVATNSVFPKSLHEASLSVLSHRFMVTITKTSASTNNIDVSHDAIDLNKAPSVENATVVQDNTSLIVTPSAVQQIQYLSKLKNSENPEEMYLRVYVDAGGCSGFQYKFEMEADSDDEIDETEDIIICCTCDEYSSRVVIDQSSLDLLKGSKVDFVREMIRSSFAIVDNPQSESACGCGSSFAVKNFEANPALD
jgi:iron-sulfur cluster assembly accessory protein